MRHRSSFLHKNMQFIGVCVDIHHSGLGVVKHEGSVVLVKDLLMGEQAQIHVMRVEKNVAYGKVIERLLTSKHRIDSVCEVSLACGGCPLIMLDDDGQAAVKRKIVEDQVKFHQLDVAVREVVRAPQRYHMRNKVAVPLQHNPFKMGFYRLHSHDIVEFETCYVQTHTQNATLQCIREYPHKTELVDVKHVVLKENHNQTQMIVGLVVSSLVHIQNSKLIEVLSALDWVVGVVAHVNTSGGNAIFKGYDVVLWGSNSIIDVLGGLRFALSLQSFYQINPHQTLNLYHIALDVAQCSSQDVVVDLYCGVGSISLLAAKRVKYVVGIEINPIAIANARENQYLNEVNNASFHVGDASDVATVLAELDLKGDVLIVDPPRSGLSDAVIKVIKELGIPKIVYVSCNPLSLCANLKALECEYWCEEIIPVDMFPNTRHVETVVLMSRKDK